MARQQLPRKLKAYSILELIVSISIMGIVMLMLSQVLTNSINISRKSLARSFVREEISDIFDRFATDVRAASEVRTCEGEDQAANCQIIVGGQTIDWQLCSDDGDQTFRVCRLDPTGERTFASSTNVLVKKFTFEQGFDDGQNVVKRNVLITISAAHRVDSYEVDNVLRQTAISTRNYELTDFSGLQLLSQGLYCGNGTVDAGEQCDDTNSVSGDGCSSTCQIELPTIPGCTSRGYIGHTYLFCPQIVTWANAEATCAGVGTHLTTVNNAAENNFLFQQINLISPGTTWYMGLSDTVQEGVFAWTDGSAVSYTNWPVGQPDDFGGAEDCGELNRWKPQNTWNDVPCSWGFPFVCESNLPGIVNPCGDGVVGAGEQCDDGGTLSGDGCSSTCQITTACGDGVDNDADTKIDCAVGSPDPGCFPDGKGGGGACSTADNSEVDVVCGNGIVEAGEQCDATTYCTLTCQTTECQNRGIKTFWYTEDMLGWVHDEYKSFAAGQYITQIKSGAWGAFPGGWLPAIVINNQTLWPTPWPACFGAYNTCTSYAQSEALLKNLKVLFTLPVTTSIDFVIPDDPSSMWDNSGTVLVDVYRCI